MDEYKKDNQKCVCVNVFVKCGKKDECGNEIWEKKDFNKDDCKKEDCCVEINIFAECDKKS